MLTRKRKMMRPVRALREIVLPHVGPTSCSLISFVEMPATVARAERSWSPFRVGRTGAGGEAAGEGVAEAVALGDAVALGLGDGDADADADGLGDGEGETDGEDAAAI